MIKFLFEKRLTLFDAFSIGLVVGAYGHLGILGAVGTALVTAFIATAIETYLSFSGSK